MKLPHWRSKWLTFHPKLIDEYSVLVHHGLRTQLRLLWWNYYIRRAGNQTQMDRMYSIVVVSWHIVLEVINLWKIDGEINFYFCASECFLPMLPPAKQRKQTIKISAENKSAIVVFYTLVTTDTSVFNEANNYTAYLTVNDSKSNCGKLLVTKVVNSISYYGENTDKVFRIEWDHWPTDASLCDASSMLKDTE